MSLFEMIGTILIGPLKLIFEVIFSVAHSIIGNPGLAVIALSLAMNVLVLPLYRRADAIQIEARDTENRLKDTIAHIKKTFSGDERMMILQTYYRQNNYSPLSVLSSSVSLLLQIPFFMAAYQFLSGVELFRGASLGPIADLSVPDGLLVIGGVTINVLPIIMTLVNVISSSLYLKGFPLKSQIQLYGMALFFLVFLYNSPAALVFYWTLNNVFSLVKTLFYKMKHSKLVLTILLAVVGVVSIGLGLYLVGFWRSAFLYGVGLLAQLPWALPLVKKLLPRTKLIKNQEVAKPNKALFVCGAVFLTLLVGLMIPATYVAASPQEYIETAYFYNPVWYVVNTLCLSAGLFLVWFGVFYWLANEKGKVVFDRLMPVLCGVMLVNYMFFGTNLGVLSPDLIYNNGMSFTVNEQTINVAVLLVLAIGLYLLAKRFGRSMVAILLTGSVALTCMGSINFVKIGTAAAQTKVQIEETADELPSFSLSQNGKNVIVIMLDRSIGPYVPYILAENPTLQKQFDGFTYYSNTLSYGAYTNFGSPALYGGYEYTPVEMNRRPSELLASKHNEALKVMPTLFSQADYDVTVIDPSYAGYRWTPDLSIFDGMNGVSAYLADGKFNDLESGLSTIKARKRNFFFFSAMKSLPISLQSLLYTNGTYRALQSSADQGAPSGFMSAYNALKNINTMTTFSEGMENTFMFLRSNVTHEAVMLQEPNYTPSGAVDNSAYRTAEGGKVISANGETHVLTTESAISHYHVNAAAFMILGEWFDCLRENGVYDSTRIILVSDHGAGLGVFDQGDFPTMHYTEYYRPLLLVKDFNANGFTTSDEFMTNADTPTLAVEGLIESPINPFTGKAINSSYKTNSDKQYVIVSNDWDIQKNGGNQFLPSEWATFSGDSVANKQNWTFHEEMGIFPPDLQN